MPELPTWSKYALVIGGVLAGLFVILITISFGYLDYNEYGFKRQKSTSRIFTDHVYKGGRYMMGPDFDFKIYPAAAKTVSLAKTTVFSKDTLEVFLDIHFHYFLRPSQLHILHRKYQLTYHAVIRSTAMDALKGAAVEFTTEQFIKERLKIEKAMSLAVRVRIGGKCCDESCTKYTCVPNCIPVEKCTNEADMGLMVDVRYFFLSKVVMPSKVYQRYLRALLLSEETQMEKYRLEEAVVVKEVDESVKMIMNKAEETGQNATAEAALITNKAQSESVRIIGQARSTGLKTLMNLCGITQISHKVSYFYLGALASNSKVNLAVDFNNYVIGGGR